MRRIGELIDASQLKDKTLIARQKTLVYRNAFENAVPFGYVSAGHPIGVVYSWVDPNGTSRTRLWWMFYDSTNGAYYTPHIGPNFDVSALKEQGVLTKSEQVAEEQKKKDQAELPVVEYYLKYYGKYALYGAFGLVAVSGLIKKI